VAARSKILCPPEHSVPLPATLFSKVAVAFCVGAAVLLWLTGTLGSYLGVPSAARDKIAEVGLMINLT